MGMYDHVTFRHRMPDGYLGGDDAYQTQDLRYEIDMASYEVTDEGKLVRTSGDFGQPVGNVLFNHTLTVDAPGHAYAFAFSEGLLRAIHCPDGADCAVQSDQRQRLTARKTRRTEW